MHAGHFPSQVSEKNRYSITPRKENALIGRATGIVLVSPEGHAGKSEKYAHGYCCGGPKGNDAVSGKGDDSKNEENFH